MQSKTPDKRNILFRLIGYFLKQNESLDIFGFNFFCIFLLVNVSNSIVSFCFNYFKFELFYVFF